MGRIHHDAASFRLAVRPVLWVAAAMLALPGLAAAQKPQPEPVPELIAYQGLVYLEDGSTDVTGTYDVEFYLYHEASGGTAQWGEALSDVQVSRGLFSVLLGGGTPITGVPHGAIGDVFKSEAVYVEMRIDGDNPLRIRQRYTSSAHAYSARNAVTAVHGVPAGTVMPFAGGTTPYGWLACNGASYTAADYPDLFAAIGTIWGGGGGSFLVPNLGGRIPVGVDGGHALAVRRGAEQHTLTISEIAAHAHGYQDKKWSANMSVTGLDSSVVDNSDGSETRTTGSAGSGLPHNNMQPVAVVRYIIKW